MGLGAVPPEILAQMQDEARHVLPGASPQEAMRYLDEHSKAVEGVEQIRRRLQQMMDEAIADLDGTHFELAEPIKTVEAMIAPGGQRGRAVLHRRRRRTSPGPAGPGCRRWAAPGSRSGT